MSNSVSIPVADEEMQETGHLAWCALVALHLAKQDGGVLTDAQASLFLTRWLATAEKQRRFPRSVASDISWLLNQGRTLGVRAKLATKIEYMWRTYTGNLAEQDDMFRLTFALEMAKEMGWVYQLLAEKEWMEPERKTSCGSVNTVSVFRQSLDTAFDNVGSQINPLIARLTGNVVGFETLLNRCGWQADGLTPDGVCQLTVGSAV